MSEELLDEDKKNYNFVQINKGFLKQYRNLIKKSSVATEILMFLVEKMGVTTNAVVCSYKTLEEVTGYSRSTIARSIKLLKQDNWIDAVRIGNATAYCVNARVFWQKGRNEKKYAMFQATVIASESEQDTDYRTISKRDIKHIPLIDPDERPLVTNEVLPPPDQQEMSLS